MTQVVNNNKFNKAISAMRDASLSLRASLAEAAKDQSKLDGLCSSARELEDLRKQCDRSLDMLMVIAFDFAVAGSISTASREVLRREFA